MRTVLYLAFIICSLNIAIFVYADGDKQEEVVQHKTIELTPIKRQFSFSDKNEINLARKVVKKYWISSYEDTYTLFSSNYKKILKNTKNISDAKDYKNSISITERTWIKQTYQNADMQNNKFIQITVLAAWEEEGYDGVMTFIFDMVKENNEWKIANIMY